MVQLGHTTAVLPRQAPSREATLRNCQAVRGAMPIVIVCRLVTARLGFPPAVGTQSDQIDQKTLSIAVYVFDMLPSSNALTDATQGVDH